MQIFNVLFLSVIITPQNVPIPRISKTHLPIVLVNVRDFELSWCPKELSRKKAASHVWGAETQLLPNPHKGLPIYRGMLLLNTNGSFST